MQHQSTERNIEQIYGDVFVCQYFLLERECVKKIHALSSFNIELLL